MFNEFANICWPRPCQDEVLWGNYLGMPIFKFTLSEVMNNFKANVSVLKKMIF